MDADEVTEWAAYAQLDPFGGARGDWQAALVASMTLNGHAGKMMFKPDDLMPKWGPPRAMRRMSPREIRARLEAMRVGRSDV